MTVEGTRLFNGLRTLAGQDKLHGPVASTATAWRVLDAVDEEMLTGLRRARAVARERAWAVRGQWT